MSELPTRVVDVSPGDGPATPRLFLTKGQGTYAALSCCWGGPSQLEVTHGIM